VILSAVPQSIFNTIRLIGNHSVTFSSLISEW